MKNKTINENIKGNGKTFALRLRHSYLNEDILTKTNSHVKLQRVEIR